MENEKRHTLLLSESCGPNSAQNDVLKGDTFACPGDRVPAGVDRARDRFSEQTWLIVVTVTTFNVFVGICYHAFPFFYMELVETFEVNQAIGSWVGSIQLFVSMVTSIFFSGPVRRYGIRNVSLVGATAIFVSLVVSSYAPNIYVLYLTYGLIPGLGLACLYLVVVVISQNYFHKHRTLLTCIVDMGFGVGHLICPSFIVYLVEAYTWRGALLITSGIIAHLFVCILLLPDHRSKSGSFPSQRKNTDGVHTDTVKGQLTEIFDFTLMNRPIFAIYISGSFLIRVISGAFLVHIPSLLVRRGISKQETALLVMIMPAVGVMFRPVVGSISDIKRIDRFAVHMAGAATALFATWIIPFWPTYEGTIISFLLYGFHSCAWYSLIPVMLVDLAGVQHIDRSFSINQVFAGVATLTSPPLAGWLFDMTQNYNIPFYVNSCIGIVGCGLVAITWFLVRRRPANHNEDSVHNVDTPEIESNNLDYRSSGIIAGSMERM